MSDPQSGKGALKLRTGITVIGHGIMAQEAQAVGVNRHWQAVPEKEAVKMLEMIPSGVGGDKDPTQEFSGMIIDRQEQGLLFIGRPPLVDGGIVLPEFINRERSQRRRAFGRGSGWQIRSGKCVLAKAATDSRWRLKPRRVCSSSATSWKLGGFWRGRNSLRKAMASGGQSGQ